MKKISVLLVLVFCLMFSVSAANIYDEDVVSLKLSVANQNPDPAIAGEVMTVYLGIENLGGEQANDISLEFIPSYPFSIATGESIVQEIGSMGAYQGADEDSIKIVNFKILVDKDVSAGSFKLKFRYYDSTSGISSEKYVYIDIDAKQNAEIVKIDKTIVVPGEESELTFTITNVGSSPLKNMVFYWENEDEIILPVGSDNTKYIKYLEVGKSTNLQYKVIADTNADAGLYKLNLYLSYEDATGETKETNTIAGVYVGGGTDFDVVFSENSGSEVSFSIANTGSNPANSVSVVIPDQKDWKVTGSTSAIIGNLNQGDYTVATFTLSSNAAGMNSSQMPSPSLRTGNSVNGTPAGGILKNSSSADLIKVHIVYTDTMGQRQTLEKTVRLSLGSSSSSMMMAANFGKPTQNQSFLQKYKWYLIGALIIFAGVIGYRKYKSKKTIKAEKLSSEKKAGFFKSK